jgi:hypothetical protein
MRKETYLKVISLLLFTVSPLFAQENTQLIGNLSAPYLEGASIHIINSTQKTGTVNSDSGSYKILVRENDELLFSSVQYKNVTILITSEIIIRGVLNVVLEEDLNVLAEVNISNINLTGDIAKDIANMEVIDLPVNINFGDVKGLAFEADINDPAEAPRNRAFESNTIMQPGVNIMGLHGAISDLLGIKKKPRVRVYKVAAKTSSEQLRQLFQEDFFINTLELEKDYIEDFIFYAEDQGLSILLENSNKLVLIEFLMEKSKKYKMQLSQN